MFSTWLSDDNSKSKLIHACTMTVGMSSIWSGSIHHEINDFDVISICQYAQSMCGGPYTFVKCTFLSGKKLPQKTVNGILTSSTMCYIRHMCLF